MARMYSRRKGKSASKRPIKKTQPTWLRYKEAEVELLITKLAKEGNAPSVIGLILRDTYGIPDVKPITGKSITATMKEKKLLGKLPEDLLALIKKAVMIKKHLEENRHDQTSKRGLTLTESKIKRLVKYYKRTGRIEETWKYDPDKMGLYLE